MISEDDFRLIKLPLAEGCCRSCLEDPAVTFRHKSGKFLVSYCEHNMTGGFIQLTPDGGIQVPWKLYTPVDGLSFAKAVDAVVEISLRDNSLDTQTPEE